MTLQARTEETLKAIAAEKGGEFKQQPSEWKGINLILSLPIGEGAEFIINFTQEDLSATDKWASFSGTTNFTAKGKRYSFDRMGIDSSFYLKADSDLREIIEEQIKRIEASQERLARSIECNLGPVTVQMTSEAIDKMLARLKAGETYTYTPAGFGTGYQFSIRNISNRFDRVKASKELELLVGKKIYVTSIDCD